MYNMINDEWRAYFAGVEEYMNCMNADQRRVIMQSREYLRRRIEIYGEDAVMKPDTK